MGQKTSIYLADDVAAKAKASGIPLGELVRRGLEGGDPESPEAILRRVIREETAPGLQISVLTHREDDDSWHLAGSFDYRNAERFRSDGPEDLYRTIKGRWVLHAPAGTASERVMAWTYATDDQARDWLRENGHEQALQRFAS